MAELRWHPLIRDWIIIASHRQDRPQMPKGWCPFCPGSGRVPDHYEVMMYENDFPALSMDPPPPDDVSTGFFRAEEAYGKCEVVLYSPEHGKTLPELPIPHVRKLVDLWTSRYVELKKDPGLRYIFIFENRGEAVGVTMPHPHGQIYGYPFLPKKIQLEMDACREHLEKNKRCLICEMNENEASFGKRVISEDEHFIVYLPFFTEYPYGVYIVSKRHLASLEEFTEEEKNSFSVTLRNTVGMFDALFDMPFPYMMCMHQEAVNMGDAGDISHFHVEFFPPMRSENKLKYNASSETGAWAHCNPTCPEEKAKELRDAWKKFTERG
ncbi:MAG: galactose-1-phosphate uridylyltransferase [Clostridia bacterium]